MEGTEIALYIFLPLVVVLLILLVLYFLIKIYRARNRSPDRQSLISSDGNRFNGYTNHATTNNLATYEDINLVDKVKNNRLLALAKSRESAFVYMQFFIRSNPEKKFATIEHLETIGSQLDRNWFIVKQDIVTSSSKSSFNKLVLLNSFNPKYDANKTKLINIEYSMSINSAELCNILIGLLFHSNIHIFYQSMISMLTLRKIVY